MTSEPRSPGGPCPHCLRPQATAADCALYEAIAEGDFADPPPPEWGGPDGPALCWREAAGDDGACQRPEWFAAVTPLDVVRLAIGDRRVPAWGSDAIRAAIAMRRSG